VRDDPAEVTRVLREQISKRDARVIITTGGTGISLRDVTPEATTQVADRIVPGFGELMRARSLETTAMAPLSRAQAATRGRALIVNLPGSVSGATENLTAVLHLIPHALELLDGRRVERHPEGKND
jgi:Molybdopterin biosynthesis enzymes